MSSENIIQARNGFQRPVACALLRPGTVALRPQGGEGQPRKDTDFWEPEKRKLNHQGTTTPRRDDNGHFTFVTGPTLHPTGEAAAPRDEMGES